MQNNIKSTQTPKINQNHTLMLENQSRALITGVQEVITATEKGVLCKLNSTNMQIIGENLRVEKLSPEERLLVLVGNVYEIKYSHSGTKSRFFKKLFR